MHNDYSHRGFRRADPEPQGDRGTRVPRGAVRVRRLRGPLVHGEHRDLDGGRGLRRHQRQPLLPDRQPADLPRRRSTTTRAASHASGATSPSGCPAPAGPGCSLVRQVWETADASEPAAGPVLPQGARPGARRPRPTDQLYGDFSTANRRPASFYEEGADYKASPLAHSAYDVTAGSPTASGTPKIDHLSSNTFAFRPRTGSKQLKLTIDSGSGHKPVAEDPVVGARPTAAPTLPCSSR